MSIVVYNEVGTPIIPAGDLAGPVRDALGGALRSMRYVTPNFAGLYQDAAGTTPVTEVGQPVGLMLDRRFGLERGPELVSPEGWVNDKADGAQWDVSVPGIATITGEAEGLTELLTAGNSGTAFDPAVIGRTYEVRFDYDIREGGGRIAFYRLGGAIYRLPNGQGTYHEVLTNITSKTMLFRAFTGPIDATISNWSVRELPGNHASQTTTTARPTLRSGPLRIDYDGVDDYLRTVFPDLGDDVTIARSIPGVGAQILTGQTIAAGDWDDNVDSCATLVIDRALTGPEAALVTAFLNQQAGV